LFLAGSAAAHAVVLGALPQFAREDLSSPERVLEVSLLKTERMEVASPPSTLPKSERGADRVAPRSQSHGHAPVPELPEPREMEGGTFTVEPARATELAIAAPAPEPGLPAAGVPTTPPGFGAAYLRNPPPSYPPASRHAGEQGTVMLRVRVAVDGSASRVTVEKSSGSPHLDAAALEAVKAWRFTPARRGAEAVESWMLVPVVFRLESAS
jgi:protein TonB